MSSSTMDDEEISIKVWSKARTRQLIQRIKNFPHAWMWANYHTRHPKSICSVVCKLKTVFNATPRDIILQVEYLGKRLILEIEKQSRGGNVEKWEFYDDFNYVVEDWKQVCKLRNQFVKILAEYPEVWRCQDSPIELKDWRTIIERMQKLVNTISYFKGKVIIESKLLCSLWNNTYLGVVLNKKLLMQPQPISIRSFPQIMHYYSDYSSQKRIKSASSYFILNDRKSLGFAIIKYPNTSILRNNWPPNAFYSTQYCSYSNYDVVHDEHFRPDYELNIKNDKFFDEVLLFMFLLKIYRRVRDQIFFKNMLSLWGVIRNRFMELGLNYTAEELKERWEGIIKRIKRKMVMGKTYPGVSKYNLSKLEAEIAFYFPDLIKLETLPDTSLKEEMNGTENDSDHCEEEIEIKEEGVFCDESITNLPHPIEAENSQVVTANKTTDTQSTSNDKENMAENPLPDVDELILKSEKSDLDLSMECNETSTNMSEWTKNKNLELSTAKENKNSQETNSNITMIIDDDSEKEQIDYIRSLLMES